MALSSTWCFQWCMSWQTPLILQNAKDMLQAALPACQQTVSHLAGFLQVLQPAAQVLSALLHQWPLEA